MPHRDIIRRSLLIFAVIASIAMPRAVLAQQENPVYVDDSPLAWELFQRARDHVRDNAGEAVRLYQQLLDEYPYKLVPAGARADDHFVTVRARVLTELRSDVSLLDRYRRVEEPHAQRLFDSGDLSALARSRSLTQPGLRALMLLAQRNLEAGAFDVAAQFIAQAETHPDLDPAAEASLLFMIGVASLYQDNDPAAEDALRRLDALQGAEGPLRRELARLTATRLVANTEPAVSALDRAAATNLDELAGQPIWTVRLNQTLLYRRYAGPDIEPENLAAMLEHQRNATDLMTLTPLVVGSRVFVNQGYSVVAIDRFTGRQIWPQSSPPPTTAMPDRDGEGPMDMSFIAVEGDRLVTLTGHAMNTARSTEGAVTCLDTNTGGRHWRTRLDTLGTAETFQRLFPYGSPVIIDGQVLVLARKVSDELLTSDHLVSLDLQTGSLRWIRFLASSGGIRTRMARPLSTLIRDGNDVYVSSSVGIIARIHGSDGEIRWLRRFNTPIFPATQERNPWEITGPVVTAEYLIAVQADQLRIIVLDKDNGERMASFPAGASGWGAPRYLLADDDRVYAVSNNSIRAYLLADLATELWRLPPSFDEANPPVAQSLDSLELAGRVQLVQGALIVPTIRTLFVIDAETSAVIHRMPWSTAGNPLAVDSQLIVAGADRVDAYMPFARAESMLRDRLVATPADPEPALSLLRLARQAGRLPLALEAASLSLNAVAASSPPQSEKARDQLFAMLLELERDRPRAQIGEIESLYTLLGEVAATPPQRVAHQLVLGDWYARRNILSRAVDAYQSVLSDPALSPAPHVERGTSRPAADWAVARLTTLIDSNGIGVYARESDLARVRLEQLRAAANPAALLALAAEFPFAPASVDATLLAADSLARNNERRAALAALMNLYRRAPDHSDSVARILTPLINLCRSAGWDPLVNALVSHAFRSHGNVTLNLDAAPVQLADLVAAAPLLTPKPRLGAVGVSSVLTARLVPIHPLADISRPRDRVLLIENQSLRLLAGPDLVEQWSLDIQNNAAQILRFTAEELLLFLPADNMESVVMAIDPVTGRRLWSTPRLGDLVALPEPVRQRTPGQLLPDGRPFQPSEFLPLIYGDQVILVTRNGVVTAFSLDQPDRPQWAPVQKTIDQVHYAQLHPFGLVIAGRQWLAAGPGLPPELVPVVLVLDPESGRTLHRIRPTGDSPVRWMLLSSVGTLIVATDLAIESLDLLTGRLTWTNATFAAGTAQQVWPYNDNAIILDRTRALRTIDLATGELSDPFDVAPRADWDSTELQALVIEGDAIFAHYKQRIVKYNPTGGIVGADVILDDRDFVWLLPAEGRLLVVNRFRSEPMIVPGQQGRRREFLYRLYILDQSCKLVDGPRELQPIRRQPVDLSSLIDGWLLLSADGGTLAVKMSGEK